MKSIIEHEMCTISCGISIECVEGLVGEAMAYSSLFFVTSTLGAGLAVAGLFISPFILAIACKNG